MVANAVFGANETAAIPSAVNECILEVEVSCVPVLELITCQL